VPLPTELERLDGARELHDWFGYWPGFHDAEVLEFHLNAGAPSSMVVHTWEMTKQVNTQGYCGLIKHVVVEFLLEGIVSVDIVDFRDHSILLDLSEDKIENGFRMSFSAAYGLSGTIEAHVLSLRIKPGKPIA